MITVDACGLSCPQPVILAMNAWKENPDGFAVTVDNPVAVENITRFAEGKGLTVSVQSADGIFTVAVSKQSL